MNRRHLPVDGQGDDRTEIQARRAGRIEDIADGLRPVFTSDPVDARGLFAETFKTAGEIDTGPFSLEDVAIIFVHKGVIEATLLFAGIRHALVQGGLAVLPAATAMTLCISNADFTVIYLNPERIPGIETNLIQGREIVPTLDPRDVQLPMLLSCIRAEMQSGFPSARPYSESLALALATRIYTLYGAAVVSGGTFRGGLTAKQVRRAQHTMLNTLDKSVPLAALAEEARLSPWHFSRAFKQSTGMSPHRWMLEQRFELARRLMADDRMTLTRIALELGFASLSHFSAAFKRATGISPSRYRRKFAS
jgi:AraC family transcriptional regulator